MAENESTTIIGADTHINGEMSFDKSARILGKFEGTIKAKGQLHVAEGASCKAQIDATDIIVDGSVKGNITAADRVQLNAKSKIVGDLIATKLTIAEGASFTGHVTVGTDAVKGTKSADLKVEVTDAAKKPAPAAVTR